MMYKSTWKKSKKLRKENQEAEGHVVIVKNFYEVMEFIYDVGTFFFDICRMLRDVVQEIVDD